MSLWKSTRNLAVGAAVLGIASNSFGYVESFATPWPSEPKADSITISNTTPDAVTVPGVRYTTTGAYSWYNPFSNGITQTHNGEQYQSVLRAFDNGSGWIMKPGQLGVAPAWGSQGRLQNVNVLIDAGGCADPAKPQDAPSITVNDIDAITADPRYYDANYRYADTLGANGGEFSARWVDTFFGQTQVQWATGGTTIEAWENSPTSLSADGNANSPFYWMALAGGQELFSMDAQYLMAIGAKETGTGTTFTGVNHKTQNSEGAYGPFDLEGNSTGVPRMLVYPKFYPKYKKCLTEPDGATLYQCLGREYGDADPNGVMGPLLGDLTESSDVNSAQMANAVIMSGLLIYHYYDMIGSATDFCGRRAFSSESADPYLGLCAIAGHYNLGINGGAPGSLKNTGILGNPNGCDGVPQGNSAYVPKVRSVLVSLTTDQMRWAGGENIPVIDKEITFDQVQTYFWGDGGSLATPGQNGLLWHFDLSADLQNQLWSDVTTAYNKLSSHWGGTHISFRYDWLTLLRVAKAYLDLERPFPVGDETGRYMSTHSTGTQCDNTVPQDKSWPFIEATGDLIGGFNIKSEVTDYESDILYFQYKINSKGVWNDVPVTQEFGKTSSYEFTIPASQIETSGDQVWLRAADECKNEVAMKLRVEGVKLAYLDSAWANDTDGDGQADIILFAGRDHEETAAGFADAFASASEASYKWPDASSVGTATNGDGILTINTTGGDIVDPNLIGARSVGAELTLQWPRGSRSTAIQDRVGPVILSASVHERLTESQNDTLFVTFSEPINNLPSLGNPNFIQVNDVSQAQLEVFNISGTTWGVVYSSGVVAEDDMVNLVNNSGLTDQNGNPPLASNIKRTVILNKGPVPLEEEGHGFYDTDADGKMDRIELQFKIPLTKAQVDAMKFSFQWLEDDAFDRLGTFSYEGTDGWQIDLTDPTKVYYDIKDNESIRPEYTYINPKITGMGAVEVQQQAIDANDGFVIFTPNVPDKMGPIIVEGGALLAKTSRPDIKSDLLRVRFSEPLQEQTIANNYLYKIRGQDRQYVNSLNSMRYSANTLIVAFSPDEGDDRPNIGDSLKIETSTEFPSVITDLAGNIAHPQNPRRIIEGKVIVIFFSPDITKFNASQVSESNVSEPWGYYNSITETMEEAVFFPAETSNEEIYKQYGLGFGFSTSFANKSSDRSTVKFKVDANIYSNLGGFVVNLNDEFTCEDVERSAGMQNKSGVNACTDDGSTSSFSASTEFKVFYPWNFQSSQDRFVGSGAYFINLNVRATAFDGEETVPVIEDGKLEKTFGVIRSDNSSYKAQVIEPFGVDETN